MLGLDVFGLLVVLVILSVVAVLARRAYLRGRGGSTECAVRLRPREGGRGWSLGVAHFGANTLHWYRLFSLAPQASLRLDRKACEVLERRPPTAAEQRALQPGVEVVRLSRPGGSGDVELALDPPSVTVLLTWLESAPPGSEY